MHSANHDRIITIISYPTRIQQGQSGYFNCTWPKWRRETEGGNISALFTFWIGWDVRKIIKKNICQQSKRQRTCFLTKFISPSQTFEVVYNLPENRWKTTKYLLGVDQWIKNSLVCATVYKTYPTPWFYTSPNFYCSAKLNFMPKICLN